MKQRVTEALQFNNNLTELKEYFDKKPFNNIKFDDETSFKIMMDSGYTHNLTTKFWRILKTLELIEVNKAHIPMSVYLLEVFTNQCLSFTDILATWVNHFLNLGLNGASLSTHNDRFVEKFKNRLTNNSYDSRIDIHHEWSKTKLYPYRNIIHHMGELSGAISMDRSFVAVPKETEWDFVQLRKDLKGYPSQTAFQIATNTIKLPNIITGDPGDSHRYENIVDFALGWRNKLYDMVTLFVEIVVSEQSKKT